MSRTPPPLPHRNSPQALPYQTPRPDESWVPLFVKLLSIFAICTGGLWLLSACVDIASGYLTSGRGSLRLRDNPYWWYDFAQIIRWLLGAALLVGGIFGLVRSQAGRIILMICGFGNAGLAVLNAMFSLMRTTRGFPTLPSRMTSHEVAMQLALMGQMIFWGMLLVFILWTAPVRRYFENNDALPPR